MNSNCKEQQLNIKTKKKSNFLVFCILFENIEVTHVLIPMTISDLRFCLQILSSSNVNYMYIFYLHDIKPLTRSPTFGGHSNGKEENIRGGC